MDIRSLICFLDLTTRVCVENVRTILDTRGEEVRYVCYVDYMNKKKGKSTKLTLIIGHNNIFYVKSNGKIFHESHQLDITKIISEKPTELSLVFKSGEEIAITTTADQIDSIIDVIRRLYFQKFSDITHFELKVKPDSRLTNLTPKDEPSSDAVIETYKSLCNYHNIQPDHDIIWVIHNLHTTNKTFDLSRFTQFSESPIPERDLQPILHALGYDSFFKSAVLKSLKMDKFSLQGLVDMLTINKTIQSLTISDLQLKEKGSGFTQLFTAMSNNPSLKISMLDASNISLDDKKDRIALGTYLQSAHTQYLTLNLSTPADKGSDPEGVKAVFSGLKNNTKAFTNSLTVLNLSGNKIESADALKELESFIKGCKVIEELDLSGTKLNINSFTQKALTSSSVSESLRYLNLSDQKLNKDDMWSELIKWISNDKTTGLETLDISGTQIPPESFIAILIHPNSNISLNVKAARNKFGKETGQLMSNVVGNINNIKSINIADNSLGDDGILSLAKGLYHKNSLQSLNIDRNFRLINAKVRKDMINYLAEMANSHNLSLQSLSIAGASRNNKDSRLKDSVIFLLQNLVYNTSITEMDITGHGMGNAGAIALARMLEQNQTITKLKWDDNATGLIGFQNFKNSLMLNNSLKDMPMPYIDISKLTEISSQDVAVHELVLSTLESIQSTINKNQLY
eukprot:TRINITY_DN4368_c0_g2_i1.p1 TRINITY_DN4368_c0_g2~~TRINITY_DN4368_c0_g2_i1.p1  ORF type:complete len:685 (-),score=171.28 TRINITY_DN4368_c0_g2_i1:158-2212(-)